MMGDGLLGRTVSELFGLNNDCNSDLFKSKTMQKRFWTEKSVHSAKPSKAE